MNPAARAEARIKQLCCLGLPSETIMPTLLAQMHTLVPGYAYNFFWCDEDYAFTNLYMENLDEIALLLPRYYSEYCNRAEEEVVFSFVESARGNLGVETLESSLKVDKRTYDAHGYYNDKSITWTPCACWCASAVEPLVRSASTATL